MARLISRNVEGVSKLPYNEKPGGTLNGNTAPPAARNVAALSSVAEIEANAFGLQTNPAGGSSIG
jgi:hypothetical protein